jgi:hypothetical protein
MGEPLTRIMGIFFFALMTLLPRASAEDISWGTEDLFLAPNTDIYSGGSSWDLLDLPPEYSPEADYSVDAWGSSLAYLDENQAQNLPADDISGGDLFLSLVPRVRFQILIRKSVF